MDPLPSLRADTDPESLLFTIRKVPAPGCWSDLPGEQEACSCAPEGRVQSHGQDLGEQLGS